jgi:hypothetical protein
MPIAETRCWMIGPYSVQQRPRPDNPAWAVYIVFRGDKLIGKSFSIPDIGCCRWLQAHQNGQYALPAPERGRTEYGYCAGRRSRAQDNIYKARAFSRTARRIR